MTWLPDFSKQDSGIGKTTPVGEREGPIVQPTKENSETRTKAERTKLIDFFNTEQILQSSHFKYFLKTRILKNGIRNLKQYLVNALK